MMCSQFGLTICILSGGMNDKRQPVWSSGHELQSARRELQKIRRRRSERRMLLLIVLGPMFLYVAYEIIRGLLYVQGVQSFTQTINTVPPDRVKVAVQRYARDLNSQNTLVRTSALAAMRVATGWHLGADSGEWTEMWAKQEPYWEYHRPSTNALPAAPDWRKQIPSDLATQSTKP